MNKKVKIFIDSSSTFDKEFLKKNNVSVIPLSLSDMNNQVYSDDGTNMNPNILFKEIANGNKFKTSATPLGVLMTTIEDALDEYDVVYFIPISHGLSSQWNQARMIEEDHPGKFFVIKSTSAALANEFVLYKLIDLIKTKKEPKEIVKECEDYYLNTDTYFSCEDISDLLRGGRVTSGIVKIIKMLKLKPIILLDTKNQRAGMSKNYQDAIGKIIDNIDKDYDKKLSSDDIEHLGIYYSGYEDTKKDFILDSVSKAFNYPKEKILIRWVPTIVLAHTRKGAYGITVATKTPHKKREIKVD